MVRPAILVVAACALFATACTASHPASELTPAPTNTGTLTPAGTPPVRGSAYASGGCGDTPLLRGTAPGWASNANPPRLPYALAARGQAAGFLFHYPLTAGDPSDKILWIVATPRDGQPLNLSGHPLGAAKPVVTSSWPADSEPGEIYPSFTTAPSPGCWQFTLSWNGHTDTVDLWYAQNQ